MHCAILILHICVYVVMITCMLRACFYIEEQNVSGALFYLTKLLHGVSMDDVGN